jgi:transmembrane sensor
MNDDLEETAAYFLLRAEDGTMSEEECAALDAWLSESIRNKAIYWRLEHGWKQVDRVAALNLPPVDNFRWSKNRITAIFACVGVATAATVIVVTLTLDRAQISARPSIPAIFSTDLGQRKHIKLVDGSTMDLNTDTEVRVSYAVNERSIRLVHGEALFDVVHDLKRPFLVSFGDRRVVDIGTQFSVRSTGGYKEVMVLAGRVNFVQLVRDHEGRSAILNAGDMAVAVGSRTLTSYDNLSVIRDKLAWNQGMIVLNEMSLGNAAREFNRYNARKVQIDDPAIAGIQIGGAFKASNVEAFARLICAAYGLKLDLSEPTIKISHR